VLSSSQYRDLTCTSHDETATHFLLRLTPSGTPIGTIRAYKAPEASYYKLSRLAVLKDYRSYRFGRELVLALQDWVKTDVSQAGQIVAEIVLHSQLYVKGFYAKLVKMFLQYHRLPLSNQ
jgi:predicted GNAT family N-acyltransferase